MVERSHAKRRQPGRMASSLFSRAANGERKFLRYMGGKSFSGTGVCREMASRPSAPITEVHRIFRSNRSSSSKPASQSHAPKELASAARRLACQTLGIAKGTQHEL